MGNTAKIYQIRVNDCYSRTEKYVSSGEGKCKQNVEGIECCENK